jgi:putative hydrolase of the HAD superfamily
MRVGQVKAVTFDFYNTLVCHRSGKGRGQALVAFLAARGFAPGPWEHRFLYDFFADHAAAYSPQASEEDRQLYYVDLTTRAFRCLGIHLSRDAGEQHAKAVWAILGPRSLMGFPEVHATLHTLSSHGLRLAVLSNWQAGLSHFCEDLGFLPYFDHVVSSAELGYEKPDVRTFHETSARLGVPPEQIVHVGDSFTDDYDGARAAGFQAILLDRNGSATGAATRVIRSLREVPALLGEGMKSRLGA